VKSERAPLCVAPRRTGAGHCDDLRQELSLVPQLTVSQNVLLGHEPSLAGWIDRRELRHAAVRRVRDAGLDIDPDERVDRLIGVAATRARETGQRVDLCSRIPEAA
jgi:inositol transport system ATP-binding protein